MRRFATAAVIAGAALASSAGSANAFFHLLFQSEQQTQAQQYYRNDPSSRVQISPVPREVSGKIWTSRALRLPSACFTAVVQT